MQGKLVGLAGAIIILLLIFTVIMNDWFDWVLFTVLILFIITGVFNIINGILSYKDTDKYEKGQIVGKLILWMIPLTIIVSFLLYVGFTEGLGALLP